MSVPNIGNNNRSKILKNRQFLAFILASVILISGILGGFTIFNNINQGQEKAKASGLYTCPTGFTGPDSSNQCTISAQPSNTFSSTPCPSQFPLTDGIGGECYYQADNSCPLPFVELVFSYASGNFYSTNPTPGTGSDVGSQYACAYNLNPTVNDKNPASSCPSGTIGYVHIPYGLAYRLNMCVKELYNTRLGQTALLIKYRCTSNTRAAIDDPTIGNKGRCYGGMRSATPYNCPLGGTLSVIYNLSLAQYQQGTCTLAATLASTSSTSIISSTTPTTSTPTSSISSLSNTGTNVIIQSVRCSPNPTTVGTLVTCSLPTNQSSNPAAGGLPAIGTQMFRIGNGPVKDAGGSDCSYSNTTGTITCNNVDTSNNPGGASPNAIQTNYYMANGSQLGTNTIGLYADLIGTFRANIIKGAGCESPRNVNTTTTCTLVSFVDLPQYVGYAFQIKIGANGPTTSCLITLANITQNNRNLTCTLVDVGPTAGKFDLQFSSKYDTGYFNKPTYSTGIENILDSNGNPIAAIIVNSPTITIDMVGDSSDCTTSTILIIPRTLTCTFPVNGTGSYVLPGGTKANINTATGVSNDCTYDDAAKLITCTGIPSINGTVGLQDVNLAIGGLIPTPKGRVNLKNLIDLVDPTKTVCNRVTANPTFVNNPTVIIGDTYSCQFELSDNTINPLTEFLSETFTSATSVNTGSDTTPLPTTTDNTDCRLSKILPAGGPGIAKVYVYCQRIPSIGGTSGLRNVLLKQNNLAFQDKGDVTLTLGGPLLIESVNANFTPTRSASKQFKTGGDLSINVSDSRIVSGASCVFSYSGYPNKSNTTTNYINLGSNPVIYSNSAQATLLANGQLIPKWRFKVDCTNPTTATNGYAGRVFTAYPDYSFKYGAIVTIDIGGTTLQ